ncbi:TPA: AlwI family type II restriction endonuclease [Streptococcus suis]|nr:AlwI family type II restriction endonuclease [Streptococcus suis]
MATFGERFLLGFTSPRNPHLISEYVKVIEKHKLDGMDYNIKFQELFYDVLSKEKVAGVETGTAKDKALAGRDKLTRMPQVLGFFITQQNKKFKVTEAGKLLLNDSLFDDVLVHQMLKFQLPSALHKEKDTNKGYFRIKPFLELLRLIDKMEYLTYNEFLTYGMTFTNYKNFDKVVNDINDYRKRRDAAKRNKESLRNFDHQNRVDTFKALYQDIIASGNIKTRESQTNTTDKYVKKKLSNLSDYADSIFRLFQASGLVINSKGRSLQINPKRKDEVDYILENVSREILPVEISRDDFDKYITNPRIPVLLNDSKENILNTLKKLGDTNSNKSKDIYDLKVKLNEMRNKEKLKLVRNQIKSLKSRRDPDIADIINTFEQISNKEIEPANLRPTYLEWNVWRAMTMINHGNIVGNFIVDDMGNPIATAGGGQSDIIGDYGEFKIGIEVTLSTGMKQYEMEGEPVSRHIGELQKQGPAFGIFIADKLSDTVISHFYISSIANTKVYNGRVDIIPMSTATFVEFFEKAVKKDLKPSDLYQIHEHSLRMSKQFLFEEKTEKDWHKSVISEIFNLVS